MFQHGKNLRRLLVGLSLGFGLLVGDAARASALAQEDDGDKKAEKKREPKGEKGEKGEKAAGRGRPLSEEARAKLLKEHPEADTDKDGKLSQPEALAWIRDNPAIPEGKELENFLKRNPDADKNKDGKLSREEMREWAKQREEQRLAGILKENPEADKNKDGKLSREEAREWQRSQRKDGDKGDGDEKKKRPGRYKKAGKKGGADDGDKKADV